MTGHHGHALKEMLKEDVLIGAKNPPPFKVPKVIAERARPSSTPQARTTTKDWVIGL
jgi:hypothetical protein